jgi:hypothetical protein
MTAIEYKVRAYAQKEQVSIATVRLWIAKGAETIRRTPGGGIRIVEHSTDGNAAHTSTSTATAARDPK